MKKKKKTNLDNIGNDKINKEYSNFDYTNENRIKENLSVPRKSNRKRSPVNRYGNPVTHFIYVNYIDANVPSTFEEANNSKENKNCQEAMNKNKTQKLVDRVQNKKNYRCKMGLHKKIR